MLSKLFKKYLPVSSRSFHAFESYANSMLEKLVHENNELKTQISQLHSHNSQLLSAIKDLKGEHEYEQMRDMLFYWQLYRKDDEDITQTKRRFLNNLPKATGINKLFQDVQVKLFKEFDQLCRENSIRYWTCSGTLLGAYIYRDIIPWDDDIDVFVMRSDLQKLQELLAEKYSQFRITECWDWYVICKQIRLRLSDQDNPAFIDLYPMDAITSDVEEGFQLSVKARADFVAKARAKFADTAWKDTPYLFERNDLYEQIEELYTSCVQELSQRVNFAQDIEAEDTTGFIRGIENITEDQDTGPYPKQDWLDMVDLEYRDFKVLAPRQYLTYLHRAYGDFYKIPRDVNSHEHVAQDYISSTSAVEAMNRYLQTP